MNVYVVTADRMPAKPTNLNFQKLTVTAMTATRAIKDAEKHWKGMLAGDYILTAIKQGGTGEYAHKRVTL